MTAALAPDVLTRLIKLAGMLGSAHDGERAAAAQKCNAVLSAHGLTWQDLLQPPAPVTAPVQPDPGSRTWRVVAEEILIGHYGALRQPKEVEFLTGLLQRGRAPSERQDIWLRDIARRCGVPAWQP